MAVVVTARAQKADKPSPACQLLDYAAVDNRSVPDMRVHYKSARLFWDGFGLDVPFTDYVQRRVFPGMDLSQPEISPVLAGNFAQMPPTLVSPAGFYPLRVSDRSFASSLKKSGVHTVYLYFSSLPLLFFLLTSFTSSSHRVSFYSSLFFFLLFS